MSMMPGISSPANGQSTVNSNKKKFSIDALLAAGDDVLRRSLFPVDGTPQFAPETRQYGFVESASFRSRPRDGMSNNERVVNKGRKSGERKVRDKKRRRVEPKNLNASKSGPRRVFQSDKGHEPAMINEGDRGDGHEIVGIDVTVDNDGGLVRVRNKEELVGGNALGAAAGENPASQGGNNKRVRTIFTPDQLEKLEDEFNRQQYMVGPERLFLAASLRLTEAQVSNCNDLYIIRS
jgi:hypothetical protein